MFLKNVGVPSRSLGCNFVLTENHRDTGVSSVDATYWMGKAIRLITY